MSTAWGRSSTSLLTGEPPFKAETALATLIEVVEQPPQRPSQCNVRVPADLETICLKCLEKEPSARYSSAMDLAEDLKRFRNGESIHARSPAPLERALRGPSGTRAWPRSHLSPFCALVLAVVTLAASNARIAAKETATARALVQARQALSREQRMVYVERVALASRLWSDNHLAAAERLLDECPPQFRHHWEWAFLNSLRQPHLDSLEAGERASVLSYSPDGRYLASAGESGAVTFWDTLSGRVAARPVNHGESVRDLAFSPDGSQLATADRSGVKVWDMATRAELFRLPGSSWAAFSPDGRYLATANGGTTHVWAARTGHTLHTLAGPMNQVSHGAFSLDGRQSGQSAARRWNANSAEERGALQIWDLSDGKPLCELRKYHVPVQSLAYEPDVKRLLVGQNFSIVETEALTGRIRRLIETGSLTYTIRMLISHDCRYLAYALSDHVVRVWDLKTWRKSFTFRGHTDEVTALAFSPDGRHLSSGGKDRTIKVWDLTLGNEVRVLTPLCRMSGGVAFSPTQPLLAAATVSRTADEGTMDGDLEPSNGRNARDRDADQVLVLETTQAGRCSVCAAAMTLSSARTGAGSPPAHPREPSRFWTPQPDGKSTRFATVTTLATGWRSIGMVGSWRRPVLTGPS